MSSLLPRKWHHSVWIRDAHKQFYLVLKQGRGLIFIGSNSKGQIDFINPWKSKDIKVLTLIEIFVTEWNKKSLWKLNPCECGLFSRSQWPYSLHIFSLVSLVKKCATCKAIVTFQRGPIHTESTFTVFFFHSLTYITINVRHIQSCTYYLPEAAG